MYTQKRREDGADFGLTMNYGVLTLDRLELPCMGLEKSRGIVTLNGEEVEANITLEEGFIAVTLNSLTINQDQTLQVSICR